MSTRKIRNVLYALFRVEMSRRYEARITKELGGEVDGVDSVGVREMGAGGCLGGILFLTNSSVGFTSGIMKLSIGPGP